MAELAVAFAFALLLTSIFALRFRHWQHPGVLTAYFLFFGSVEWLASRYLLPPGAMGIELAYACSGLALLIIVATYFIRRYEQEVEGKE